MLSQQILENYQTFLQSTYNKTSIESPPFGRKKTLRKSPNIDPYRTNSAYVRTVFVNKRNFFLVPGLLQIVVKGARFDMEMKLRVKLDNGSVEEWS